MGLDGTFTSSPPLEVCVAWGSLSPLLPHPPTTPGLFPCPWLTSKPSLVSTQRGHTTVVSPVQGGRSPVFLFSCADIPTMLSPGATN